MLRPALTQEQKYDRANRRLRALRKKTIRLGIISTLTYPVLNGFSRLLHVVTVRDGSSYPTPDPISDVGMVIAVFGLSLTVALSILYGGLRDWSDPHTRSKRRARRTALVGLIVTPFSFALLAMVFTVIDVLVHKGTYP